MPNEILTGARYPSGNDSPNIAQYFQNAVTDLADNTIPPFATVAARNTAYSAWVSAGNVMRDGLTCTVDGYQQVWRAGSWRGTRSFVYTAAAYTGGSVTGTANTLRTISIADPGYPWQALVDSMIYVLVSPGSDWNYTARVDSISGALIRPVGSAKSTSYTPAHILGGVSDTLTGARSILFNAERIAGVAGDGFQVNTTANLQQYRVQVVPA